MRALSRLAFGVACLALASGAAYAQGVELVSGQRVVDTLDAANATRIYRFQVIQGDLLTLRLSVPKRSGLAPVVSLIGPAGAIDLPEARKGKLTLKKAPLGTTGTCFLFLAAAGTTGEYSLALKLKSARVPKSEVTVPAEVSFTAPRGSVVTLTAKAARGHALEPGIDSLRDARGTDHLDPLLRTEKGKTARLRKHPIASFGEHRVSLVARAGGGAAGVSVRIKPAKPFEKKLSAETLVETNVCRLRRAAGGGGFEYALIAEVRGGDVAGATLVHPDGSESVLPADGPDGFRREVESGDDLSAADGDYRLIVRRAGGVTREYPFEIGGPWPGAVEVIGIGVGTSPRIDWTGGAGAQAVRLRIVDLVGGVEAYEVLLPGGTTSHIVPEGPLTAGRAYEIEVIARTSGHRLTGSGTISGSPSLDVTTASVELAYLSTGDWRPTDFYRLEAAVAGTGIREVSLQFPSGHLEEMEREDEAWRFRSVSGRGTDFEEGTYVFIVEPIQGATDRSRTVTVGGGMPDWSQGGVVSDPGLLPVHLGAAGTNTPQITWPALNWTHGYEIEIHDGDDEIVHRATVAAPSATSYAVPAGVLHPDEWYTVVVGAVSSQAKAGRLYATIYTGTGFTSLGYDILKLREGLIGGGATTWTAEAYVWVEGDPDLAVAGARLIGVDHPAEIVLSKDGDEYAYESPLSSTEDKLNGLIPDGFWRLEITFANGSVCRGIFTWVGGDWPDWIKLQAPIVGATSVSRTPELTWSYGSLANLRSVGASIYSNRRDEEYAYMWDREPSITTIPWAGFDERQVTELPADSEVDVEVFGNNGHNKRSVTTGIFITVK